MATARAKGGKFTSKKVKRSHTKQFSQVDQILIEHNFSLGHVCSGDNCETGCPLANDRKYGKNVSRDGWKDGRRIIELSILLNSLRFCRYCSLGPIPLTYDNIVGELQKGLGGYLYVKCQNPDCGKVNTAPYGSIHHEKNRAGAPCFTVNTKLGTAMIDSIGGPDRVNNFLTALNIKPICFSSMKKMERRAGPYVESVAERSMSKAATDAFQMEMRDIAEEEINTAKHEMDIIDEDLGLGILPGSSPIIRELIDSQPGNEMSDDDSEQQAGTSGKHFYKTVKRTLEAKNTRGKPVKLEGKFGCRTRTGMSCAVDTGWSKRGFDSLTSHTYFMSKSKYGKKVVKTVVLHRTCATCKWWKKNRPFCKVRHHRCVFNHKGSARLMESASAVKGIKSLNEKGLPVEIIEGDGDNTTLAHVYKDLNISLKKRYDRNHVVKNVGKKLYSLRNVNKKLSKTIIEHLEKCLKYAFAKNQGDKDGLKDNLCAIIPHQFADHTLCKPDFCGYKRDSSDKYVHRSLPYKAPLKDPDLRSALEGIFKSVIQNSEQYSDLGSSQQCEHANRALSLRAPKHLHYGNSESLDYRAYATSAFINEGRGYLSQVYTAAGLSPGIHTQKYAEKTLKKRQRVQENSSLPSAKRRRLVLKKERVLTQAASEAMEGQSYESGVALENQPPDLEEIPAAVPHGRFKKVVLPEENKPTFITFDLETTDLIRGNMMPHITQIAAVELQTRSTFNVYVTPKVPISTGAQEITGIVVGRSGGMTVNGQPVNNVDFKEAANSFIDWLSKFENVFLIAHNGQRFDFPVLDSALGKVAMFHKFCDKVTGYIDSKTVFQQKLCFGKRSSYNQEGLVRDILKQTYNAHDAVEDVKALGRLVCHPNVSVGALLDKSFEPMAVHNRHLFLNEKKKNIDSLSPLVSSGVMKTSTAENVAGSGLNLTNIRVIYRRDGEDGLLSVFTCKNSEGQVRVTDRKKVLEEVIPKLCDFFKSEQN